MNTTTYYELPIYEPNDQASFIDGYNKAMLDLDSIIKAMQNEITLLTQRIENLEK